MYCNKFYKKKKIPQNDEQVEVTMRKKLNINWNFDNRIYKKKKFFLLTIIFQFQTSVKFYLLEKNINALNTR